MLLDCFSITNQNFTPNFSSADMAPATISARIACMREWNRSGRSIVSMAESVRSEKAICELANDEHHEVRIALVDNIHTPEHVMLRLATDEHVDVRYAVADNASSPWTALLLLENDDNPYIADRARRTMARLRPHSWRRTERRELTA